MTTNEDTVLERMAQLGERVRADVRTGEDAAGQAWVTVQAERLVYGVWAPDDELHVSVSVRPDRPLPVARDLALRLFGELLASVAPTGAAS
jgi:hypothetical protein